MTSTLYPFSVHSALAAMFSLHTFACASHYIAHLQPSTAAAAAATSSVVIDTWQRPLHTHTHTHTLAGVCKASFSHSLSAACEPGGPPCEHTKIDPQQRRAATEAYCVCACVCVQVHTLGAIAAIAGCWLLVAGCCRLGTACIRFPFSLASLSSVHISSEFDSWARVCVCVSICRMYQQREPRTAEC